jgi:hypothetical protein
MNLGSSAGSIFIEGMIARAKMEDKMKKVVV